MRTLLEGSFEVQRLTFKKQLLYVKLILYKHFKHSQPWQTFLKNSTYDRFSNNLIILHFLHINDTKTFNS